MNENNFLLYNEITSKIDYYNNDLEYHFKQFVEKLQKGFINYSNNKLEDKILKLLNPNDINFFQSIKNLIINIKKYFKEENQYFDYLNFDESNVLILDYSMIINLTNIIINIIERIKEPEKFFYKETFNNINLNFKINDFLAKNIIDSFTCVKIIKIRFNKIKNKEKINLDIVTFFSYFFKVFFPCCIEIDIDFNIIPINEEFQKKNYYEINERNIISYCSYYEKIFLSNLILAKAVYSSLDIINFSIKIYDSYQIESHYILSKLLSNNNNNNNEFKFEKNSNLSTMSSSTEYQRYNSANSPKKNNKVINPFISANVNTIIYSSELNNKLIKFDLFIYNFMKKYLDIKIEFNSFDPLLFHYINQILIKNENLDYLELKFFPDENISLRKILLNSEKYNLYCKKEINNNNNNDISKNNNICETRLSTFLMNEKYNNKNTLYYEHLNKDKVNKEEIFILKDEQILNELFNDFNKNLFELSIILNHKMGDFCKLSINLSNYIYSNRNIENFDNYNSSITCFIINLFSSIQNLGFKLDYLEIIFNDDNQCKKNLFDYIKLKKNIFIDGFKFNKLKISELFFDFRFVSSYIKFENFPPNLSYLKLKKLNFDDFELFLLNYKSENNSFKKLETINISFDYDFDFKIELIEDFIFNFKSQLKKVILEFPINLDFKLLIKLIEKYKKSKSNNTLLKLKIYFEEISNQNYIPIMKNNNCNIFEDKLIKNNIIKSISFPDYNNLILNIPYYKYEDKLKLIPIIHCFEKIWLKNNEGKKIKNSEKIFKNVFDKINKLNEKNMEIEII
jgi:hypothetical protein